jgi:hypothetical protein
MNGLKEAVLICHLSMTRPFVSMLSLHRIASWSTTLNGGTWLVHVFIIVVCYYEYCAILFKGFKFRWAIFHNTQPGNGILPYNYCLKKIQQQWRCYDLVDRYQRSRSLIWFYIGMELITHFEMISIKIMVNAKNQTGYIFSWMDGDLKITLQQNNIPY